MTDILSKNTGSTNKVNVVKATIEALTQLRDPLMVAKQRGIKVNQLFE